MVTWSGIALSFKIVEKQAYIKIHIFYQSLLHEDAWNLALIGLISPTEVQP
jgi:hypothetical protein